MLPIKSDTNYVYKAEYFFKTDNGYGNCTEVNLPNPTVDGTFSFNIPLGAIPAGADTLFIRVQDSTESKWSLTVVKDMSVVLPLTLLNFNVVKQNNTPNLAGKLQMKQTQLTLIFNAAPTGEALPT